MISAMIPAQLADTTQGVDTGLYRLRDWVWCLAIPYGNGVPTSNAYLLRGNDGGVHVIDPGSDSPRNRGLMIDALETLGVTPTGVRSVSSTHLHHDHLGLAAWLCELSGVPLALHPADLDDLRSGSADSRYSELTDDLAEKWGAPGWAKERLRPTRLRRSTTRLPHELTSLGDGSRIVVDGHSVTVIATPGHTSGSVCFLIEDEQIVLTGDHLLPHINAPIGRDGTGGATAVADYLASLAALADFDEWEVGPGHGYCFGPLGPRRLTARDHVLDRAHEVRRELDADPAATTWEVASNLTWGPGWENLTGAVMQSALAQTALYQRFVTHGSHTLTASPFRTTIRNIDRNGSQ
ncbi:Glyoxylase, beta-lactamase superfamily II [Microbacterium sp. cf046]|uniref:MBL fold metallo-hydrolase n=1 Tax=Microbacterium sp. cf046 TaxID=1761803 RepID=UPI0008E742BD|nr:MBL fold metallo-hydrolase [Microbacterium sp. cf046]SFS16772.1 Glyoxylase, beta-lactamase superfamily II [Microbacterium sp. cf046]